MYFTTMGDGKVTSRRSSCPTTCLDTSHRYVKDETAGTCLQSKCCARVEWEHWLSWLFAFDRPDDLRWSDRAAGGFALGVGQGDLAHEDATIVVNLPN